NREDALGDADGAASRLDEALDGAVPEAELEQAFAAAGVPLTEDERDYETGELWSTQVERFVEGLDDGLASAEELADRVDVMRQRLDRRLVRDEMQAPVAVHAHHAAVRLAASLAVLAQQAVRERPPLVEHVLLTEQSVYEVSAALYGTA